MFSGKYGMSEWWVCLWGVKCKHCWFVFCCFFLFFFGWLLRISTPFFSCLFLFPLIFVFFPHFLSRSGQGFSCFGKLRSCSYLSVSFLVSVSVSFSFFSNFSSYGSYFVSFYLFLSSIVCLFLSFVVSFFLSFVVSLFLSFIVSLFLSFVVSLILFPVSSNLLSSSIITSFYYS